METPRETTPEHPVNNSGGQPAEGASANTSGNRATQQQQPPTPAPQQPPAIQAQPYSQPPQQTPPPSEKPPIQETAPGTDQKAAGTLSPVRTYKQDVSEAVRRGKETVSSIVSAEQERKKTAGAPQKPSPGGFGQWIRAHGFMTAAVAAVFLLFVAGGSFFYFALQEKEPVITPKAETFISVNKEVKINIAGLDKPALEEKIRAAQQTPGLLLNEILAITFSRPVAEDEETARIVEVLSALAPDIPQAFLRALGENYLYGVHVLGENVPFLIVEVNSYEAAFSTFFDWEPEVPRAFAVLFNITRKPAEPFVQFSDALIKNRDVRVVRDEEGTPILFYSFVTRKTMVITSNQTTFEEILNRLATPRRTIR